MRGPAAHSKAPATEWLRLMPSGRQVPCESSDYRDALAGPGTTATARVAHSRCATRTKILSPAHMRDGDPRARRPASGGARPLLEREFGSIPPEPHRLLRNYRVSVQERQRRLAASADHRHDLVACIRQAGAPHLAGFEKGVVLRAEHATTGKADSSSPSFKRLTTRHRWTGGVRDREAADQRETRSRARRSA